MALKPADKKIIDTFTDGVRDIAEGPKSSFYARSGTLYGPMGSKLARLSEGDVLWIGTGGTSYQDDTYRYLKKTVPSKRFKGHGTTPNGRGTPPPPPRRRSLPKPPARAGSLPRRTYKDIIHDYEREKYPFDYAVRNGSTDELDWANEIILRGIILGFWLQGWADAMDNAGLDLPRKIDENTAPEPPEALNDFAMKFAADFSSVNGNKPLFAMARLHEDELEAFGYAVAMEAVGHGSNGWLDEHDRGHLKIPAVEVHFELEDEDDETSAVLTWAESSKRLAV